ncbi:hypothetical protein AKJ16_DCAP10792 [Drosera capensis]
MVHHYKYLYLGDLAFLISTHSSILSLLSSNHHLGVLGFIFELHQHFLPNTMAAVEVASATSALLEEKVEESIKVEDTTVGAVCKAPLAEPALEAEQKAEGTVTVETKEAEAVAAEEVEAKEEVGEEADDVVAVEESSSKVAPEPSEDEAEAPEIAAEVVAEAEEAAEPKKEEEEKKEVDGEEIATIEAEVEKIE